MKTIENRIDQSVNFSIAKRAPMKNSKNYVPVRHPHGRELKLALVKRLSAEYAGVAARLVYQAVNEAYALASLTPEPLLVLPALAEEKVQKRRRLVGPPAFRCCRSDRFALAA